MRNEETAAHEALAGKYMTFKLAGEEYGVPILRVRELIGVMEITRVPRSRNEIRGVINLRGKVIPVLDLRRKFGLPDAAPEDAPHAVIIVVHVEKGGITMGILVDEVLEVRAFAGEAIEPPPEIGRRTDDGVVMGVGKLDKRVVFLLDVDQVIGVSHEGLGAAQLGALGGM